MIATRTNDHLGVGDPAWFRQGNQWMRGQVTHVQEVCEILYTVRRGFTEEVLDPEGVRTDDDAAMHALMT